MQRTTIIDSKIESLFNDPNKEGGESSNDRFVCRKQETPTWDSDRTIQT